MTMSKYNLRVRKNINYNEDLYFDKIFKNVIDYKIPKKNKKQKSKEQLISELRMDLIRNDTLFGHDKVFNVLNIIDSAVYLMKHYDMPSNFKFVVIAKIYEFSKAEVSDDVKKILNGFLQDITNQYTK